MSCILSVDGIKLSVVFTFYVEDEIYKMQYASDTKSLLTRLIFVLQEKII